MTSRCPPTRSHSNKYMRYSRRDACLILLLATAAAAAAVERHHGKCAVAAAAQIRLLLLMMRAWVGKGECTMGRRE